MGQSLYCITSYHLCEQGTNTCCESQPMPFHSEKSLHLHKVMFEYLVSDCVPWNAISGPGFQSHEVIEI